jgi:DNA topoisomerase-1
MQKVAVKDATLARLVRRCQDLPGQQLFQYVGEDGEAHPVGSADVNAYLREASGAEFTAKHFRTWGASVIAFETILDRKEGGLTMKELLQPVADALGNTPAISRKSYIHPLLLDAVKTGQLDLLQGASLPRATRFLSAAERGLIALLEGAKDLKAAA